MSDPLTADQIKANAKDYAKALQPSLTPARLAKVVIEITEKGISISTFGVKPPKTTPEPET